MSSHLITTTHLSLLDALRYFPKRGKGYGKVLMRKMYTTQFPYKIPKPNFVSRYQQLHSNFLLSSAKACTLSISIFGIRSHVALLCPHLFSFYIFGVSVSAAVVVIDSIALGDPFFKNVVSCVQVFIIDWLLLLAYSPTGSGAPLFF